MTREGQIGHLLGTRGLVDLPTEVALRGEATQVLVSGLSCVDAQLKVDRNRSAQMRLRRPSANVWMHARKLRRPGRAALHRSRRLWLGMVLPP